MHIDFMEKDSYPRLCLYELCKQWPYLIRMEIFISQTYSLGSKFTDELGYSGTSINIISIILQFTG